jgi:hypothetical protein
MRKFANLFTGSSLSRKGRSTVRYGFFIPLFGALILTGCKSGDSGTKSSASQAGSSQPEKGGAPTKPEKARMPGIEIAPNPVTLKKGETKKMPITIERAGLYDKEFKIEFDVSGAPGIKIAEVTVPGVKPDKQTFLQKVEAEVVAEKDAKGGEVIMMANPPDQDAKIAKIIITIEK